MGKVSCEKMNVRDFKGEEPKTWMSEQEHFRFSNDLRVRAITLFYFLLQEFSIFLPMSKIWKACSIEPAVMAQIHDAI